MNKRRTLLITLSSLLAAFTFAGPVSVNEAKEAAIRFLETNAPASQQAKTKALHAPTLELAYTATSAEGESNFYVFNREMGKGFIIVSGDDRTQPVLGYADSGNFDNSNLPCNFKYWLDGCRNAIARMSGNAPMAKKATDTSTPAQHPDAVESLLGDIAYDQSAPYNDLCPTVGPSEKAATGCSATAMAQVMKFHEYPEHGIGEYTYKTESLGLTLHADFENTYYDWENMLDTYTQNIFKPNYNTKQAEAIATLMYQCGVAIDMDYNTSSSATDYAMLEAFATRFGYNSSTLRLLQRDYCTSEEWKETIRAELAAGYPVIYNGQSMEGGHSFVCDGYDANGLFHINWGWGGLSNGYFDLDILEPNVQGIGGSMSGFSFMQSVITGIRPAEEGMEQMPLQPDLKLAGFAVDKESMPTDGTANITIVIANNGLGTFNGHFGIKVEPADGQGRTEYHTTDKLIALETGTWNLITKISGDMFPKEKEYYISIASQADGDDEWAEIPLPPAIAANVKAIVADGIITFTTEDSKATVEASGFQAAGELYSGREGAFNFTITNTGTVEYNQPLMAVMVGGSAMRPTIVPLWMQGVYIMPEETCEMSFTATIDAEEGEYTAILMTAGAEILAMADVTVANENAHLTEVENEGTRIYPIPTEDWLCIKAGQTIRRVEIFDLSGTVVQAASPGSSSAKMHVPALPKGTYLVKVRTDDETVCRKIMKE